MACYVKIYRKWTYSLTIAVYIHDSVLIVSVWYSVWNIHLDQGWCGKYLAHDVPPVRRLKFTHIVVFVVGDESDCREQQLRPLILLLLTLGFLSPWCIFLRPFYAASHSTSCKLGLREMLNFLLGVDLVTKFTTVLSVLVLAHIYAGFFFFFSFSFSCSVFARFIMGFEISWLTPRWSLLVLILVV